MRITIVGAGPIGLLTSCLLSLNHQITLIDKRIHHTRNYPLNINSKTTQFIYDFLANTGDRRLVVNQLKELVLSWSDQAINTSVVQESLFTIAKQLGVTIILGVSIESIQSIRDHIIIGADGARSIIRRLAFNDLLIDQHTVGYMAQLKFETPVQTRPRPIITTIGHTFLNGITGDDMAVTFESMSAPSKDHFRKNGTLHIPIPHLVYEILSNNGRGNFNDPWTLDELSTIDDPHVSKLLRIIKRYRFGVTWRGGWIENPKITVIPLTIYRSAEVFTINQNKLILLVGDASSGCVFQRGANKGMMEAVKLGSILTNINPESFYDRLIEYKEFCRIIYEQERDHALQKGRKIVSINKTTAISSKLATVGLGSFLVKKLK